MPQLLSDLLLVTSARGEYFAPLHVAPELSATLPVGELSRVQDALPQLHDALANPPGQVTDGLPGGGGSTSETPASRLAPFGLLAFALSIVAAWRWQRSRPPNEPAP